ncbi:hypothetical protein HYH03_017956 [Edaphochlamys debaryana]|uniref:EF-hand domain-containing protein n=1 Tax=Edaphochlamys debaryana TaxID=47281 RepID=A0A835XGW9_9CHLO|nr:hypothetical protein HYH03_017956 [Edaphochlamys debaryana]|eukprot:KAG2483164.1 hypothetical protein HYH03_017956 [Edaphochlamys debaryana]
MGLFSCFSKPQAASPLAKPAASFQHADPNSERSAAEPAPAPVPVRIGAVVVNTRVELPAKAPSSRRSTAGGDVPADIPAKSAPSRAKEAVTKSFGRLDVDTDVQDRAVDQTPRKAKPTKAAAVQAAAAQTPAAVQTLPEVQSVTADASSASPQRVPVSQAAQYPAALTAAMGPAGSAHAWETHDAVKNLSETVKGPADFAPVLRPFTNETSDAPVEAYIAGLGKAGAGAGLVEAVEMVWPEAGAVFGLAYRLKKASDAALVNKDNVSTLSECGRDVLRALDVAALLLAAGKRRTVPAATLAELVKLLEECCDLAEVYTRDGWLLPMACNEHIKADFDRASSAVLEALQAGGMEVPPRAVPRGSFLDCNRSLRRTLKRVGSGSIDAGLRAVGTNPLSGPVVEMSGQLGVSAEAVARELAGLPEGVPLDVYYNRVMRGEANMQELVERWGPVFRWHDKAERGYITPTEFTAVLQSLGTLDQLKAADAEAAAAKAFSTADEDCDGRLSLQEFARYVDVITFSDARRQLRLTMGLQAEEAVKQFYNDFASFGSRQAVEGMDSAHFAKLFRDMDMIDAQLTMQDIDLAFTRAKPKGGRLLTFDGFVAALAECAGHKGLRLEGLVRQVLAGSGPVARATKTDSVRLHDDRSTYTGVYAQGGPRVASQAADLASMLDRDATGSAKKPPSRVSRTSAVTVVEKPADKAPPPPLPAMGMGMSQRLSAARMSAGGEGWKRRSHGTGSQGGSVACNPALYDHFLMFAQFGAGGTVSHGGAGRSEMGPAQFVKLLRDCGLLDAEFTTVQADITYTKVKRSGKLSFDDFRSALALVAKAKGVELPALEASVVASQGPHVNTAAV